MGIDFTVIKNGKRVKSCSDNSFILERILSQTALNVPLLSGLDKYGDTRLQYENVRLAEKEVELLIGSVKDIKSSDYLSGLLELIRECRDIEGYIICEGD